MISNSAATHAKVAIYIRVSTLHQIDRDSLPMQRQDLIAYAKLILNTDDVTVFEDAGYSGKNTIRPEFQKMMSQLRTGTYTHLLVWKIDRISRNLLDFAEMYQELKDLGVTFVSKNEQFDTSTATVSIPGTPLSFLRSGSYQTTFFRSSMSATFPPPFTCGLFGAYTQIITRVQIQHIAYCQRLISPSTRICIPTMNQGMQLKCLKIIRLILLMSSTSHLTDC